MDRSFITPDRLLPDPAENIEGTAPEMTRRGFTTGLVGAGLAAPMLIRPGDAVAGEEEGVAGLIATALVANLLVFSRNNPIQISQIVFLLAQSIFILSMRRAQKAFIESGLSANQQASFLIGQLTVVAPVLLLGSILYIVSNFQPARRNATLIMPAKSERGDASLRPNLRLRNRNASIPSVNEIKARGVRVGNFHAQKNSRNMGITLRNAQLKF